MSGAGAALRMSADGGSLRVTLCRAQVRNALDIDLVEALIEALDEAAARGVHSVILDAEGPAFCAGLDLGDMASRSDGDFLLLLVRIETLLQRVYRAPFQTLALAQGAAFGAGADLLAACRRRVATADLRIAFPGVRFGVFLGTRRLAARVGSTQAERILGDARTLNGAEALALGLVTDVAPPEDWDGIREQFVARGAALDPYVGRHLGDVLAAADDAEDMATLVRSASRPGLKQRIADYAAAARRR